MGEIDQLEASIANLTEDIAELTKALSELDSAMAKATKLCGDEKAKNTDHFRFTSCSDCCGTGADSIERVLCKGMGGESGGVVAMLEVTESDFARLEAGTKAAEATAQKEYDTCMTDSK